MTKEPFEFRARREDQGVWRRSDLTSVGGVFSVEPDGVVAVARARWGHVRATYGRDDVSVGPGELFICADPSRQVATDCRGRGTLVEIDVSHVQRVADEAFGSTSARRFALSSLRPSSRESAARLTRVMSFVDRYLEGWQPAGVAAAQVTVADLLAAAILVTFPNTLIGDDTEERLRRDGSATVALAVDFIEHNAQVQITTTDVAAHVMVTPRALQMAFREHLSVTPSEYLRRYRLARVRRELLEAAPESGTSVTEVATRWGFFQSSRFVARYRELYGESPSTTLRRS